MRSGGAPALGPAAPSNNIVTCTLCVNNLPTQHYNLPIVTDLAATHVINATAHHPSFKDHGPKAR